MRRLKFTYEKAYDCCIFAAEFKHWPFCYTNKEQIARLLFSWMKSNVDLDQLILEHSGSAWWVHVSCRVNHRKNRHEAFKMENGKTSILV